MLYNRRHFLKSSVVIPLTLKAAGAFSQSLSPDQSREFSRQYGIRDYSVPRADLDFLLKAQEIRKAIPPGSLKNFTLHLDSLPIMQKLKAGESAPLYHLLQWNAFALDEPPRLCRRLFRVSHAARFCSSSMS